MMRTTHRRSSRLPRLLLLPLAALILSGCDYETHSILVDDYELVGTAISDWRDVSSTRGDITIHPGGRFAIKVTEQTQFLAQLRVEILEGSGATFYTRAVPNKFDPNDGIAFRYGVDGCSVREPDGTLRTIEHNAETDPEIIKVLVEADLTEYTVGCDLLYQGYSELEGTEYLIIESDPDTRLRISSVNYFDVDEL